MPSTDVQRHVGRILRPSLVVILAVVCTPSLTALSDTPSGSSPLLVPEQCSEHFGVGEPDAPGDYRCAGLMLTMVSPTTGVAQQVWAGQWLFVDGTGVTRTGIASTVAGVHPSITTRAQSVPQQFAIDDGVARLRYLLWKYGDTIDDLTAAALWVLAQHYSGGLVPAPTLDGVAAASGRDDLQRRAIELHDEAGWFAQPWELSATVSSDDADPHLVVALRSGIAPVSDRLVSVLVSGSDRPLAATTGADGTATVSVPSGVGRLDPGAGTVVVTTETPGPVIAFRSTPEVVGAVAQTVIVSGRVGVARAVPVQGALAAPGTPLTPLAPEPLPHTGGHLTEVIAGAATGFVVAGVGMVGAVRRRGRGLLHSPT